MVTSDIDKLAATLERQEIESLNAVAEPQIYLQLLAIYLYQHDLCNAKFLWKRMPEEIKTATPELGHIWTVGKHMWKRDFPAIYQALNSVKWSDTVKDIMKQVHDKVRIRAMDLISQAYSSINLEAVALMTGLTEEMSRQACAERNWTIDADTKMVQPVGPVPEAAGHTSSEDQLYKLTDFVSFLEN